VIDKLDIGATNVRRNKPIQLDIETKAGSRYTLTITHDNKLTIEAKLVANTSFLSKIEDLESVRSLIAYALRRAICRGIDECEIVENSLVARIDLGVAPFDGP